MDITLVHLWYSHICAEKGRWTATNITLVDINTAVYVQVSTQWCGQVLASRGSAPLTSRRHTATCEATSQWSTCSQVKAKTVSLLASRNLQNWLRTGASNMMETWDLFSLSSTRHHRNHHGDSLQDKREHYQNCSVLCCVWQLFKMIRTHVSSS